MSILEPKEICELVEVDEDKDFKSFLASNPSGFKIVPQKYAGHKGLILASSAGDFAKWMKQNASEVNVEMQKADKRMVLRSGDYWLPLVLLSSDVTLQMYLNIVANYLYDKMKGALTGDKHRVRLSAIYEDKKEGVIKRFNFEGDSDSFQKAITQFNLNEFMDD